MFVGFDTSNYTTSVCKYENGSVHQEKLMLSVKHGERGLRQSDAVFQHTVNIPRIIEKMDFSDIEAIGVSTRPRNTEGSYMPCFLVGEAVAAVCAKTNGVPLYKTSHQVGHILAVLKGTDKLDLINDKFIAFHLSGGTTESLLVKPHKDEIIKADIIARSLDLKAGQAIDRTGVMMGLDFPCGREIDRLSTLSDSVYNIKPSMKNSDCSLSGVENKAKQMIERGESWEDISKFVLSYIVSSIDAMLQNIITEYGNLPVIFSGGVSSNTMLKNFMQAKYGAYFAEPEYSLDNAIGTAVYAMLKQR